MFGYSSYLDKSMNGIKTISDGVALIQNGNATFNTINVETITSSNLTVCNLINCTTNNPRDPQSVANREYCDNNFVDKTTAQNNIGRNKTFLNNVNCSGTLTGSVIQCGNYRGGAATSGVSICTTTTAGNISIGTGLLLAGSLTIGTSASPCSINSTTTFLNLPLCSAVPNALNQLVNKSYVDDNFVDKTTGQNIGGNKTFLIM